METQPPSSAGARWPAAAAIGAAALMLALLQLQLWRWHPGVRSWDELGELARIQAASTGAWPPLYFGGHGLTAMAYAMLLKAFGPWAVRARLLSCVALSLEAWLLYRLAKARWGAVAGLGAVLALSLSAYTLGRGRTLFSFEQLPAGVLLLLFWLPLCRRHAWAWGLALGLAMADYEGWALALPGLALAWAAIPADKRPPWQALMAGFTLGAGMVALATIPYLSAYAGQRSQELGPPGGRLALHLRQVFLGEGHEEALIGHIASWPLWTLPWLILGLGRAWAGRLRWPLVSVACGLAIFSVGLGRTETNRALAAWPALCLCAGAGAGLSFDWLRARAGRAGLLLWALLPLAGGAQQFMHYEAEARRLDFDAYEYSRRLALARDFLRERRAQASLHILTGLNYRELGEVDFYLRGLSQPDGAETWVVLFDEQLPPGPRPAWGEWREFRDGPQGRALLLLRPAAGSASRFVGAQDELQPVLGSALKVTERAAATRAALVAKKMRDPFAASVVYDAYQSTQRQLAWPGTDWQVVAEQVPTQTTRQRLAFSEAWEARDPARALAWAQLALKLDPQRDSVRRRVADLKARFPASPQEHP